MTNVISITGTATTGAGVCGTVTNYGPGGATVEVMGLGERFIPADSITRVFCRALGGRITYAEALAAR